MKFPVLALTSTLLALMSAAQAADFNDERDAGPDRPLVVVDANNKIVGRLGTLAGSPSPSPVSFAYVRIDGVQTAIRISADNSLTSGYEYGPLTFRRSVDVVFASTDCSGPAYMSFPDSYVKNPSKTVLLPGGTLALFVADSTALTSVLIRSIIYPDGCYIDNFTGNMMVAKISRPPIDLLARFKEPLSIR